MFQRIEKNTEKKIQKKVRMFVYMDQSISDSAGGGGLQSIVHNSFYG